MKLKVNSLIVSGFESYSVFTSMDALTDVFTCAAPIAFSSFGIRSGTACKALINDEDKITGYIGPVKISSRMGTVTWSGKDKTGDLLDCQAETATGEWRSQYAVDIIRSIISPFGITITGEQGFFFKKYNIERNAKVIDIITELCSISGILATSDSNGNIVLFKPSTPEICPIILQEGVNMKEWDLLVDTSIGHSSYTVLGQSSFNETDKVSATRVSSMSKPARYPRNRPSVVIGDLLLDYAGARSQSDWLMRDQHSKMEQVVCSLAGLQNVSPNTLISVFSPSMQINGSKRLITAVEWRYSKEEGRVTILHLTNPYKYGGELEPITEWASL